MLVSIDNTYEVEQVQRIRKSYIINILNTHDSHNYNVIITFSQNLELVMLT